MDLSKLTNKLKEIHFSEWERKRELSNWIRYETDLNNHRIKINYLPPQEPTDNMEVNLSIISQKNEILVKEIEVPEGIYRLVMDLERDYSNELRRKNWEYQKEKTERNQKNLSEFLNLL